MRPLPIRPARRIPRPGAPPARRRRATVLAGVALVVLVAAACGDDDGGDEGSAGTFTGVLDRLPGSYGLSGSVVVADHARAREVAGLDRPDPTDGDAVVDQLLELTLRRPELGVVVVVEEVESPEQDAIRAELGFNAGDADVLTAAGLPPDQVVLVDGDIDADAVAEAVAADPVWSDVLETAEHAGVEYWSWLDDGEFDVERVTPVRAIGASLRLALVDDGAVITRTTAAMEATLDVIAGDARSLLDDEELRSIAERLDELHATAAMFTDATWAPRSDATPLERWDVLAGAIVDDDGPVVVYLLAHADEAAAQANADRLQDVLDDGTSALSGEPWSSLLPDAEVTVDGRLVEVRSSVAAERARIWQLVIVAQDDLFAVA